MSKASTHAATTTRPKSQESSQMPPPATQKAPPTQDAPGVAAGADTHATVAVVLPAQAHQEESQAADAHHGMGGLYTVTDGVRRPVQRTQTADLQPKPDQSTDQSPEVAQ